MGDRTTPEPAPPPDPLEGTSSFWLAFRDGGIALCPRDTSPLALSVDSANSYRFVCVRCGLASPWFDATTAGILSKTIPPPAPAGPDGPDG